MVELAATLFVVLVGLIAVRAWFAFDCGPSYSWDKNISLGGLVFGIGGLFMASYVLLVWSVASLVH